MERMPRLGKANAQTSCCLAKPPLWIYMHDVGFLKWIYLKVRHVLKGRAVIFSFPPQSGASFIDGAMNLACCVRGTFWWWIQVAVPEIALRFGAHLMALFSWYWTERALVRALWGCTRGFPPLWICGFLLLCLHCQNKCCCSKKQKTKPLVHNLNFDCAYTVLFENALNCYTTIWLFTYFSLCLSSNHHQT